MSFKVYLDESPELRVELDEEIRLGDKVVKPLTVTENGVYTGGEDDGKQVAYSPVTVGVKDRMKMFFNTTKSASNIFSWLGVTDEELESILKYDDTSECESAASMFSNAYMIKSPLLLDLRKCRGLNNMFAGSTVEVIRGYDIRSSANITNFISGCSKIREIWIKNIKANLQVGSANTWGHLLTLESLIHLIGELRTVRYLTTLTVGSANLEKLANIYVKTVEITDEMRANDDLIDEKLPFEVCESTDEGACLITEYVNYKNWQIQ